MYESNISVSKKTKQIMNIITVYKASRLDRKLFLYRNTFLTIVYSM